MIPTPPDPQPASPPALPWRYALVLAALCALPLVLMGLGVDFGSGCNDCAASGPAGRNASAEEIHDLAHAHVRGSFTHTLLEWSAVCAAGFAALLAFAQYRMTKEPSLPIIGMAMLCAGVMDAFHTLAADGLIRAGVPNDRFVPFTWALCRLFNSLILCVGVGLFAFQRIRRDDRERQWPVAGIIGAFAALSWLSIQVCMTTPYLPQTQFPDAFIKRPYDLLALLPYLLCGFVIFPGYWKRQSTIFSQALLLSIVPQVATQLYMAFGSSSLHDSAFNVAHILKVFAYAIPLAGLVIEHSRIFDELIQTREKLSAAIVQVWQNDSRRQMATEALRKSEERLELVTAGTNDGLWDWNIRTNEMYFSPRFKELIGFADAEFPNVYESWETRLHPDDRGRTLKALRAHLDHDVPFDVEYRLLTNGGDYRWFRARGRAVRTGRNTPIRMAGSVTDVHRQKETEEALRRSEERFELAIGGSNDGIWDWPDVSHNRQWWSPRYFELLGYQPNEIAPTVDNFHRLLHPDDHERTSQLLTAHFNGDAPFDIEHRLRAKSGEYRWFHARGQVLRGPDGNPRRMAGSITDVTERKRNELALRQAKEAAEAATRAKANFLATMSHEIRTPLNGVLGMAELLWETQLSMGQLELVNDIRASADSLLKIVNNILDFSKIEAGHLELEQTGFDLRNLVDNALRPMLYLTSSANVELTWRVDESVPRRVVGDPVRLRQVLLNLIGNAVKFTKEGSIAVEVSATDVQGDAALLQFEVKDTGIGIEPEKQRDIFERFHQADSSTTRHFGGTGLGLAITAELVRLMQGSISVSSVPGAGSTFTITARMPIDAETAGGAETNGTGHSADRPACRSLHVLLVDDTALNRRYGIQVLERAGHSVTAAESGPAAIELVENCEFDVVLMDIQMPGMDGYETTRRIRAIQEKSGLPVCPVIAFTADAMTDVEEKCLAAGMNGYVSKPVKPRELVAAIESVFQEPAMNDTSRSDSTTNPSGLPASLAVALNNVDGDLEFLRELAEIYDEQAPVLLKDIRTAIAERNWETLERSAHTLKGSSGTLGAQNAFQRALTLERCGREKCAEALDGEYDALEHDVRQLQETLHAFLQN